MNKLKHIIIVRHGRCDDSGFLTTDGKLTVVKLVSTLQSRELINPSMAVMCSLQLRALKTAQHIVHRAGLDNRPRSFPELFSCDRAINLPGAVRVIEEHAERTRVEIILIVTHLEMVEQLPCAIAHSMMGTERPFPKARVGYGEGFVIDYVNHKISEIK